MESIQNSADLIQVKKKAGPGSGASSIRSGKSIYKHKGPSSSSHSATSALVRDIISHIPDKEKPQAERLTQKIKEIKEHQQIEQSGMIFNELIIPYNRTKYFDSLDAMSIIQVEEMRHKQLTKVTSQLFQSTFGQQQKDGIVKTEAISKFQTRINQLVIAYRTMKKMYFPNDLYRIIHVKEWTDFEKEAVFMLDSAFLDSRIFVAKYIERLAYKELLGVKTQLPESLSGVLLNKLAEQAGGEYLGLIQCKVIEAIMSLARIQRYRSQISPALEFILKLYRDGLIFNSNLLPFAQLFAELALYEDMNWQELNLLDLYLELMETPVKNLQTSFAIIERKCPDLIKLYSYNEEEEKKEELNESISLTSEKNTLSRKVSRKNSIASMSSVRRLNTRSALMMSQKSLLKNFEQNDSLFKTQRLQQLRKTFNELEAKRSKDRMKEFQSFDLVDPEAIIIQAARGLSRLMLPNYSASFLNNTGNIKKVIYNEMLERGLITKFLESPYMTIDHSEVKKCLTTTIAMFVLQTTTESKFNGEHVIFYLKRLGILDYVSKWSKDPDLVVRANSAWIFCALCVHHLVPPLELTKIGIIRDMFVLFISLYLEQPYEFPAQEEGENIAEKILKMYDYDHFLDNLNGILNKTGKIQHLIFATFIFLSIYDDPNIISAVHKANDEDVDKPVEENALCGLMELLQQDTEKMKLFIKILIQFTICDDDSFQQNGIWYLKHIIINSKLNQLVESHAVDILEVFIAGSVCESEVIQQECVNVLTYLAIEKKAYQNKEDPLLDALMYLTGVQFKVIRGLAYNGLAALALHGAYAAPILLKQANIPDYFNTVTKNLKKFRQMFVDSNYKSDTVAEYSGINLLLNLSRSATLSYQTQVSERVPLILDTIAAQNQLSSEENMNEVGCLQTIRALMCSSSLTIKEDWVVPFIERVARDKSFRLYQILLNNKFVPWCLRLMLDSQNITKALKTAELLRFVLYELYNEMTLEQEETSIRELFKRLLKKFMWTEEPGLAKSVHEKLVECCLLIFVREKNIILAVTEEVMQQVILTLDTFDKRDAGTRLALSKQLASTANLPQIQNLLLKRVKQTLSTIQAYLTSTSYEERFNATRLLVFLTRSPDFNVLAYEAGMLSKLCSMIKNTEAQDAHSLVMSIANLIVYSRSKAVKSESEIFFNDGHFQDLLKLTKDNDCHSLTEAFLDLITKLLVEKEFCDKLFMEKKAKVTLVKDLMSVLIRGINHECEKRCGDLSSKSYKFSVNYQILSWMSLKKNAFNVASQLIRLGHCHSKLKKYNVGAAGLKWFKKACKSLQTRRAIDPVCESLLCEMCIYLQLHYGLLKDDNLAENLLSHSLKMAQIIKHDKISDLLQARVGALLLHSSLIAAIGPDPAKLNLRINNVLFTMTNATLPELHNLAVWSLRQLYLKCSNSPPPFDFQDAFLKAKAVKNVVPKLVEPHRPLQENAMLCLSSLFENEAMKQEFIELSAMPQLMFQGTLAFRAISTTNKPKDEDISMLAAFGSALGKLIKNRNDIQEVLEKDQLFDFVLNALDKGSSMEMEHAVKLNQYFTEVLRNLLENENLHEKFLKTGRSPLNSLRGLLHTGDLPSYEQLLVDNNVAHCFAILAENEKNGFASSPKFQEYTAFTNQLCELYGKGDYLSKTEVDTHQIVLKTLKELIKLKMSKLSPAISDDEREEFLQELSNMGGLEPLLFFEYSNVPDIREMATETLEMLAPS
ncbi:unnamed protein product [Blepharisma stoltei]|uniref:Uncharacterized protein n=1 Tax=Blepharisma stoltei TaxID=1481888 RepID=A0AAU9J3B0_9CILI|nr:unnamed protein product [Blepharisma stoltei]